MARAMVQKSQFTSADSYYHRAIYGTWGANEASRVLEARLELVQSLAQRQQDQSLLAELIPLEQSAGSDPAIAREIPELYLQAGSTGHAEVAYRALLKREPENAAAYAGLGRVEMQKGNYRSAHQNFLQALKAAPGNAVFSAEADTARKALDLDPTPRRLGTTEKFERSNSILRLVTEALQSCPAGTSPDLTSSAQQLLTGKQPKTPNNEMAEARLDTAQQLWQNRPSQCRTAPETTELLNALMRKISQ